MQCATRMLLVWPNMFICPGIPCDVALRIRLSYRALLRCSYGCCPLTVSCGIQVGQANFFISAIVFRILVFCFFPPIHCILSSRISTNLRKPNLPDRVPYTFSNFLCAQKMPRNLEVVLKFYSRCHWKILDFVFMLTEQVEYMCISLYHPQNAALLFGQPHQFPHRFPRHT